jgi:membrane protein implicated in regulation of membrane protease activity
MGRMWKIVDRRWRIAPFLVLAALFFYFSFPLLVLGIHSFFTAIIYVSAILRALPQAFWWAMATVLFTIWGLRIVIRMGSEWRPRRKMNEAESLGGRIETIHEVFTRAESSKYSQEEIRNLLRSLVLDLIVLKLDIPETEARESLTRGNWTEDLLLKTFFAKRPELVEEKHSRWPWSKESSTPAFLDEVRNILDRLESYGDFPKREGRTWSPQI